MVLRGLCYCSDFQNLPRHRGGLTHNEADVRKSASGRSYAGKQAGKVAPLPAGNGADVRKSAAGDFFQ
jgi:hypothetical protein